MNVIKTQVDLAEKVQGAKTPVIYDSSPSAEIATKNFENAQPLIKTSANDEIVARVLSFTLSQTMSVDQKTNSSQHKQQGYKTENSKPDTHQVKLNAVSTESKQFSIDTVASNVTNFVNNALTKLIASGHDEKQVEYFKSSAIAGVENGIEQAKRELDGLVSNSIFELVDKTKNAIIDGIDAFEVIEEINLFNSKLADAPVSGSSAITIHSHSRQPIKVSFDSQAIAHDNNDNQSFSITTSATNTLISIESENSKAQLPELADLINKTDDVLNTFYRKDIDRAYQKTIELGYTNEELISLANQRDSSKIVKQVEKYDQIRHFVEKTDSVRHESPNAVAEYINKYINVMQSSEGLLASREDFNQIINGIVNQMKDVQIPDLLHAINRFHSFNQKFEN